MNKTNKKKKTSWQQYVGRAFLMLAGVICGIAIGSCLNSFDEDTPLYQELLTFVGLFVFIYVAFFFHIIIHEAGHLVFGLLTGYKFSSFRVASFMWLKEDGKLKLKRLSIRYDK